MTAANDFFGELRRRGVVLALCPPNGVHVIAPKGAISPELRSEMAERKAELIALLRDPTRDLLHSNDHRLRLWNPHFWPHTATLLGLGY